MIKDTEVTLESARAAAGWWADTLGAPRFDNGGDGTAAVMAMMINATRPPAEPDQFDKFREALAKTITERMRFGSVTLGVDYGPDEHLADAAAEAGIRTMFPWKTMMWVYHDYVIVGAGYAAEPKIVWSAPDWVRPPCAQQQYSDAGDPMPWACSGLRYHETGHTFDIPSPLCSECERPEGHYWHAEDGYRSHAFTG